MITSTPTGRPESGLVEAGQIPSGIRTVRGSRQRRDEVGGQQGDDLGPASGSMLSRYPAPGRQRADDQVFSRQLSGAPRYARYPGQLVTSAEVKRAQAKEQKSTVYTPNDSSPLSRVEVSTGARSTESKDSHQCVGR